MRVSEPRIKPLPESEREGEAKELIDRVARDGRVLNIYATLAHHPKLFKRWSIFGTHVLYQNTLPARERELLILRTGWLCRSEYEWGQHVIIGKGVGLTDAEIALIKDGPDVPDWPEEDRILLRAADELLGDAFISDATWAALAKRFDTPQMIDIVFTVGQYNLVSMALNTLGVQLDEGVPGFGD